MLSRVIRVILLVEGNANTTQCMIGSKSNTVATRSIQ